MGYNINMKCEVVIVGGDWGDSGSAGVFCSNLNNYSSNSNNNVGGFDSILILKCLKQDWKRGMLSPAKSEI